jgi:hypothetical protein
MISKNAVRDGAILNRDKRGYFKKPFCEHFKYNRQHAFVLDKKNNHYQCIDCGIIDSRELNNGLYRQNHHRE